ncbi:MAG: DUF523 domain-containing protein [Vicinamibacterales bacterium]|jgi:uncharacterized protein YbbK (DUF523 family)|nr:hypothetical protein [Acidobacteriota bacterium]MDP6372975.1 DUF523 domain-containing protein [Vicinamibacterales bacterium]MDP6607838.1 DUF523 domain-containing protein [Vicinamibacterales bacterium]HAK56157.1 hypothetical protein [Acidobacteriota bacterium]|tara:strand:+ start:67 stop:597 length:531 start_codon:yes stop_codon:yes gene_type:complete
MAYSAPFRLGISACLLGEEVRHDGGHKRDTGLIDALGSLVEWVSVCPEVEIGLGTPREPIRLVRRTDGRVELVSVETQIDLTQRMRAHARQRVKEFEQLGLDGYVFKRDSPSCGVFRVPVWSEAGAPDGAGRGLFAEELMRALPAMPVEEEGRLHDAHLREHFIERLSAYRETKTS